MSERGHDEEEAGRAWEAHGDWDKGPSIILVPLDGSLEAKVALPAARLIAELIGGVIHILRVGSTILSHDDLLHDLKLRRHEETLGLVIDQVIGMPAEAIIDSAKRQKALLIVMTTRGATPYAERILRPVPEQVIDLVDCPVLLVRPELAARVSRMRTLRHILVPMDGAPSTLATIGPAITLADRSKAELDILYVAQLYAMAAQEPGTLSTPRYIDQPQYEWPAWARECLDRFSAYIGEQPLSGPTRIFMRHGDPGAEVLQFAAEHGSDLIVLEWRGPEDQSHATMVYEVLAQAQCPVMVLRCD